MTDLGIAFDVGVAPDVGDALAFARRPARWGALRPDPKYLHGLAEVVVTRAAWTRDVSVGRATCEPPVSLSLYEGPRRGGHRAHVRVFDGIPWAKAHRRMAEALGRPPTAAELGREMGASRGYARRSGLRLGLPLTSVASSPLRGRTLPGSLAGRVLDALRAGPLTGAQVAGRLGLDAERAHNLIGKLMADGRILRAGVTARDVADSAGGPRTVVLYAAAPGREAHA